MRVVRVTANLPVASVADARPFWTEVMGLSVEEFDLGWVARFTAPDGDACVQVVTEDATSARFAAVSVHVEDVDAAYAEVVAHGLEVAHPLTTEPWGVRRFHVRSPDGTVVNVVQHRA